MIHIMGRERDLFRRVTIQAEAHLPKIKDHEKRGFRHLFNYFCLGDI